MDANSYENTVSNVLTFFVGDLVTLNPKLRFYRVLTCRFVTKESARWRAKVGSSAQGPNPHYY